MIFAAMMLLFFAMGLGVISRAWEDEDKPVPMTLKAIWAACMAGAGVLVWAAV